MRYLVAEPLLNGLWVTAFINLNFSAIYETVLLSVAIYDSLSIDNNYYSLWTEDSNYFRISLLRKVHLIKP